MIFNTEYYSTLDKGFYHKGPDDLTAREIAFPEPNEQVTNLTMREIGSSEADIGNGTPLQHIQAAIRQGSAKVEFTFFGSGKSGGNQHTPESVGRIERQQIREMANLNDIKFSTHASTGIHGVAGLTKEGFSEEARNQAMREINKAIEFAADASTGGAIVFHTGEWQRPLSDVSKGNFKAYHEEAERAPMMVVDKKTGDITALRKDQTVFEPKFYTAKDYEKVLNKKLVGTIDANEKCKIEADDWVDMNGNVIKKEWLRDPGKMEKLFNRVPVFNKDKTNFEVVEKSFSDYEKEAKNLGMDPEVLFVKSQIANQVLQAKGQSLFHAKYYEMHKEQRDALRKALDFYQKLENSIPEDEKWKIMVQKGIVDHGLAPPKNMMPSEYLREQLKRAEDELRYTHESSASADAQAQKALQQMNRIVPLKEFGLERSTTSIAEAGMNAMVATQKNKDKLRESLFVAPESWLPQMYGSHPDEMRTLVEQSRKKMASMLVNKGYSENEAKAKSKEHIKATLDTGHFNTWRRYFQAKPGESPEDAEKRFDKWYLDETEKLAKDGIIGHIHLTDNFGYDDEHVTPGQGTIPLKEFMKRMEKAGIKDFIVERGSDNPMAMWETLSELGSPLYAVGKRRFNVSHIRNAHFGYSAPANYIAGAYNPNNEWRIWSEVPLE